MRLLPFAIVAAWLLLNGCATQGDVIRDKLEQNLAGDYIYDLPIEEVWPHVRAVLTEQGFSMQESDDEFVVVTDWRERMGGSAVSGVFTRYLAQAERLEADRCIVRFVRNEVVADGVTGYVEQGRMALAANAAQGYGMIKQKISQARESATGARDLRMEWRVLQRVRPDIAQAIAVESARRTHTALAPTQP